MCVEVGGRQKKIVCARKSMCVKERARRRRRRRRKEGETEIG